LRWQERLDSPEGSRARSHCVRLAYAPEPEHSVQCERHAPWALERLDCRIHLSCECVPCSSATAATSWGAVSKFPLWRVPRMCSGSCGTVFDSASFHPAWRAVRGRWCRTLNIPNVPGEAASGFEADVGPVCLDEYGCPKYGLGADLIVEKAQGEHAITGEHSARLARTVAWVSSSHSTA
jgi:hypothetical protein